MKQTGKEGESKAGMHIALVILDLKNNSIQYAGAYNPLFLFRNGIIDQVDDIIIGIRI